MQQTTLFEFTSLSDDPIFRKLKNIQTGHEIQIDSVHVRKTEKLYEIENDEYHEAFKSIEKCYEFLSNIL